MLNDDERARLAMRLARLEHEVALLRAQLAGAVLVNDLMLSVRTWNILKNPLWPAGWTPPTMQFETTDDICQWSRSDLLKLQNLGKGVLAEIERELSERGMVLRT